MRLQLVSATAILVVTLSCAKAPEFPQQRPGEADPRTAAEVTDDDVAVFEAAIAAYAQSGEIPGLGTPPADRGPLSEADVARVSAEYRLEMLAGTRRCGSVPATGWRDFAQRPVERLQLPSPAANDFDKRNARSVSLDRFRPRYLNVIRTKQINHVSISVQLPEDRKHMVEVPHDDSSGRVVVFTLPGYSAKRDVAVVEITSCAPTPYGSGSEFVLLHRTGSGWHAVGRHTGCIT
jgi:hypothetical protein